MGQKKVAFITGILGQDGTYLSRLLIQKGYEVHGLKKPKSPISGVFEKLLHESRTDGNPIQLHDGDVTDGSRIFQLLHIVQPTEVYNLAAQSHVQVSFENPDLTTSVNAIGPLRVLEAMRIMGLLGTAKYYQASTSEIFGSAEDSPQHENTPFRPRSPYGIAKLSAYWTTVNYREAYHAFAVNGILFNHESPLRHPSFVTRKITQTVARIHYGLSDCLYLGNLDARRDWGHASEYVEGMWRMLQQAKPADFVLASGKSSSVRDFVELAFRFIGIDIVFEKKREQEFGYCSKSGRCLLKTDKRLLRPAEVDNLIGDASLAQRSFGWKPRIGLNDLCAEMMANDLSLLAGEVPSDQLYYSNVESSSRGKNLC